MTWQDPCGCWNHRDDRTGFLLTGLATDPAAPARSQQVAHRWAAWEAQHNEAQKHARKCQQCVWDPTKQERTYCPQAPRFPAVGGER